MPKIILLIFFIASVLFFRFVTFYQSQPVYKDGDSVMLTTTLQEEPDFSNKGQQFTIKTSTNQIISVKAQATPLLHFGQVVQVSGKLKAKELGTGNSLLTLYYPKIYVKSDSDGYIYQASNFVRNRSEELFIRSLPPTSASLLAGIVFGAKEHFTTTFKQDLAATGVLHVIAASGMNVTFVAAALLFVLGRFMKRQIALLFGMAGIVFYVFLVGFQPSIVRAAIMSLLAFGAGVLGRQNLALFSIWITGYLMLLWQPSFLFDVGFQLSFLSTLGILLLDKPLARLFRIEKYQWLGEGITTTIASEIATLPVLLGTFGSFGMFSILVNALVLWTVPLLMTLGSIAVLVGLFFQPLGTYILYLTLPLLLFFESVVSFFGGFGWNLQVTAFPWPFAVGYYLLITAIGMFMRLKNEQMSD